MAAARSKIDYVYFIQSEATRAIKIGTSARPDARLSDLQVANSDKLTLLGTTTAHSERALHAKFASIRIHGEWFKPEPALISFLREIGLDPRSAVSLKSRSTRLHLEIRKKPYFVKVTSGVLLGYRRTKGAGTWVVRVTRDGTDWTKAIGKADDFDVADGKIILSYDQAQDRAGEVMHAKKAPKAARANKRPAPPVPVATSREQHNATADTVAAE